MEGNAARGRVTRSVGKRPVRRFEVEAARPGDDAAIRELLRGRAMGGAIRLTLEREPSVWHAAAVEGERHHAVVARERTTGRIFGLGSRTVRDVWVDGERAPIGYLAQLRLATELPASRHLLAAGFRSCDRHRQRDELPYDLTSIVADNTPARRLLERGLPGFPRYQRLCNLITLTIPTLRNRPPWIRARPGAQRAEARPRTDHTASSSRLSEANHRRQKDTVSIPSPRRGADGTTGRASVANEHQAESESIRERYGQGSVRQASELSLPAIVQCLESNLSRYQFAPVWTEDDLRSTTRTRGLEATDFLVRTDRDRVTACVAIWDQRGFKQVVVRDYAPALRRLRPLVNLLLAIAGRPRLPPPGSTLELAYLSHLAVDGDRASAAVALIRTARREAGRRGLDYLVLSLTEGNPMLPAIRRAFPARELESVLYLVHSGDRATNPELDDRCPHVEAAIL